MKKKDTFKLNSNGVESIVVVIDVISGTDYTAKYLCYSNNKLFILIEDNYPYFNEETDQYEANTSYMVCDTLIENCIIPEYDTILELAKANFDKEEAEILFAN